MTKVHWGQALDLPRAEANLRTEMVGDWHHDPWAWPELSYIVNKQPQFAYENCMAEGCRRAALLDVPKENWGTRPAVVLDVTDRLTYQALVDRSSVSLVGDMSPNAFGWRLPAVSPSRGVYSHNSKQWDGYRHHLSRLSHSNVALRTDLVSFFASIPVDGVQGAVQDRCPSTAITKRLCDMLTGFDAEPGRSGLPQRSTASAVLANMYLAPLDDLLTHHSTPLMRSFRKTVKYHSFARWMDDIWLFGNEPAAIRQAQVALQNAAQSLGLHLNSAKTHVIEGAEVARQALEVEHSAVDEAIESRHDFAPLEEMVDRILNHPEKAGRTTVKFAVLRMEKHARRYRVKELLAAANRMPHLADAWAPVFRSAFSAGSLEDWYLDYAHSDWATHQWSVAQYGRMFASAKVPGKALRSYFAACIRDANTELPQLAIAAQRLQEWEPVEARDACRDVFTRLASPHARRVIAVSGLSAGESRWQVRRWLKVDEENASTLAMLETRGFTPPKVAARYAA